MRSAWYTRSSFWNFDVIALHCYSGDKKQNTELTTDNAYTSFKESESNMVKIKFRVTINFYNKCCLPVITWNQKHIVK